MSLEQYTRTSSREDGRRENGKQNLFRYDFELAQEESLRVGKAEVGDFYKVRLSDVRGLTVEIEKYVKNKPVGVAQTATWRVGKTYGVQDVFRIYPQPLISKDQRKFIVVTHRGFWADKQPISQE